MLNGLNPSTGAGPSSRYVSSLTISMLNGLKPSIGGVGSSRYVSGSTFSTLNLFNPSAAVAGATRYVSNLTFSIRNGASPAPTGPSQRFVSSLYVSIANTAVSSLFTVGTIAERAARPWLFVIGSHRDIDTDGDGISDQDEIRLGTNPYDRDTDHDGYPDGLEVALGSDPRDPSSVPSISPPGITISPAVLIQNFASQELRIVPARPAKN